MSEKLEIIIDGKATGAVNATKQVDQSINSMTKNMEKAGQALSSIGQKMSLAITAPMALIGKKSLDMAMDVVESENLFTVSMGNMAEAATDWSNSFSKSVGLNEYEVRKQVGTFNVMLGSMGLTEKAAYDMSKSMTELAYDMASFYNLRPEEAFDKLKSGIVGMPRPLQDLGIVVNENTVKMYAYKNGIAAAGTELDETQKIMARYGAIMERTSKSQGDMARTLDSPANQMRIFKEQVNLAMIELGKGLIPVMKQVLDTVKPFIERFKDLNDTQKEWIIKLALLAAAAGPLAMATGQIINFTKSIRDLNVIVKASPILSIGGGSITLPIVAAVANAGISIYGLIDTVKKAEEGTITWKEELIKLASPMIVVLEKVEWFRKFLPDWWHMTKDQVEISRDLNDVTDLQNTKFALHAKQMRDSADATKELTDEVDDLTASLFELYHINQDVEEAGQEYEDSLKEIEKTMKVTTKTIGGGEQAILDNINAQEKLTKANENYNKVLAESPDNQKAVLEAHVSLTNAQTEADEAAKNSIETTKTYTATEEEKQKAIDNSFKALESYMQSMEDAIDSEKTSQTEKEKLLVKYGLLGQAAIDNGLIQREEFDKVTSNLRTNIYSEIIPGFSNMSLAVLSYIGELDKIPRNITTTVTVSKGVGYIHGVSNQVGEKQSGGIARTSQWVSDLNIPLVKGEAVLPAPVVRAIKEGRGSFAGLDASSGGSVTNYFNISSMVVREEADINNIATELYNMQKSSLIGAGIK